MLDKTIIEDEIKSLERYLESLYKDFDHDASTQYNNETKIKILDSKRLISTLKWVLDE